MYVSTSARLPTIGGDYPKSALLFLSLVVENQQVLSVWRNALGICIDERGWHRANRPASDRHFGEHDSAIPFLAKIEVHSVSHQAVF